MWKIPFLFVLLSFLFASGGVAMADARESQHTWFDENDLIKEVIIRNLDYAHKNRDARSNREYSAALFSALDLILVFDLDDSERTLETLAALSSYGLDGAGAEHLQCVVLRKGPSIVPALNRELEREENDCVANLGGANGVCLSREELRSRIGVLLRLIEQNSSCEFER